MFLSCGCSRSVCLAFVLIFASICAFLQLVEHISTLGCSISPHLHLSLIFLFHWHALGWLRFWVVTSCKSHETSWVSKDMQLIGLVVSVGAYRYLRVLNGAYWCLRMHTGVWGFQLVSEEAYWYLWVPTVSEGVYGCLLVSVVAYCVWGCLWVPAYWCLRVLNGVSGCLLVTEGAYGCLLWFKCFYWCLWAPAFVSGFLWVSQGAKWVSADVYWFLRVPTGVSGCLQVSEGSYGCLGVPTGVCLKVPNCIWGCVLVSEGIYTSLRVPTGGWAYLLVSDGAYVCLLVSQGSYWWLWVPVGVCGCLMVYEGAY